MRKGLGRKASFADTVAAHARRCRGGGAGGGGDGCPLARAVPRTLVIDTAPVFVRRAPRVDEASALADALAEAVDAIEAGEAADAAADAAAATAADAVDAAGAPRFGGSRRRRPAPPPRWILKPSVTNKGEGIVLVDSVAALVAAVKAGRELGVWVLQAYVPRPLLLAGGRKFHLRLYALAVGALAAYVFTEGLALFAARPYDDDDEGEGERGVVDDGGEEDGEGGEDGAASAARGVAAPALGRPPAARRRLDPARLLTNTCVGARERSFDVAASVRSLDELPGLLLAAGGAADAPAAAAAVAAALGRAHAAIAHAFAAAEGCAGAYMPLPKCFELYGVDVLLDEQLDAHLLEFNPSPDVGQTGARLGGIIDRALHGALVLAVDRRVARDARTGEPAVDAEPPAAPPAARLDGAGFVLGGGLDEESGWRLVYRRRWDAAYGAGRMRVTGDD